MKRNEYARAIVRPDILQRLPDTSDPKFIAEYRRQRKAIADSSRANPEREAEYWAWADAVQADDGWVGPE